jgi:hypothetical protein
MLPSRFLYWETFLVRGSLLEPTKSFLRAIRIVFTETPSQLRKFLNFGIFSFRLFKEERYIDC